MYKKKAAKGEIKPESNTRYGDNFAIHNSAEC